MRSCLEGGGLGSTVGKKRKKIGGKKTKTGKRLFQKPKEKGSFREDDPLERKRNWETRGSVAGRCSSLRHLKTVLW